MTSIDSEGRLRKSDLISVNDYVETIDEQNLTSSFGQNKRSRQMCPMSRRAFEMEALVELIKTLVESETQMDKCRERLVMRCPDFNNNIARELFGPSVSYHGNFTAVNVARAFKFVGLELSPAIIPLIFKRFDTDGDEEMTYSDIIDIFRPKSIALQKEVERRTIFDTQTRDIPKHTLDYIRDLFEALVATVTTAERISQSLNRDLSIDRAISLLKERGSSILAIEQSLQTLKANKVFDQARS